MLRLLISCSHFSALRRKALSTSLSRTVLMFNRPSSTVHPPTKDISALLAQPSWSVASLHEVSEDGRLPSDARITLKELHHLLRLSALPSPKSKDEADKMIRTLESQLHFVRAVQSVDTEGVEPLAAIRDETMEAELEAEITLDSLKDAFEMEEVVGPYRRIRTKKVTKASVEGSGTEYVEANEVQWDPLERAPERVGRYFVVDTSKR